MHGDRLAELAEGGPRGIVLSRPSELRGHQQSFNFQGISDDMDGRGHAETIQNLTDERLTPRRVGALDRPFPSEISHRAVPVKIHDPGDRARHARQGPKPGDALHQKMTEMSAEPTPEEKRARQVRASRDARVLVRYVLGPSCVVDRKRHYRAIGVVNAAVVERAPPSRRGEQIRLRGHERARELLNNGCKGSVVLSLGHVRYVDRGDNHRPTGTSPSRAGGVVGYAREVDA